MLCNHNYMSQYSNKLLSKFRSDITEEKTLFSNKLPHCCCLRQELLEGSLIYLWLPLLCFPHEQKPANRSSWTADCSWWRCTPKGSAVLSSCGENHSNEQTLEQERMLELASPSQRAAEEHIPPAALEVIHEDQAPLRVTVDSVPRGQLFHGEALRRLPQEFIQWRHRHSFSLHFLNHHGDTFPSAALRPAEFPNDHFRTAV